MPALSASTVAQRTLSTVFPDRFPSVASTSQPTSEPVSVVLLPLGGKIAAARHEEGQCGEMIAGPLNPEPINGRELSAADYSGAGLVSGIFTRALIQPLDVLKIRFQLQEEPIRGDKRGKYTSIIQSIRTVFREEGTGAFWKGHVPAQGLSAVYGLVQFTTFEMLRNKLSRLSEVSPYKKSIDFACGAVAGCTAMTAAMPMDVLRTRLVAQGKHKVYRSATHAIGVIWRTEKVPGFFRGIVPSLAQIAPYTGLQFTCYNFLSRLWTKYVNEQESSGAFVCGALAGTFAKTLLYPLDLVRHRLQVNANIRRGFGKTSHYKGMIRTILRIARRESLLGLYKGLAPSLIKAAANSGFSFLFYELTCDLIRSLRKGN